MGDNLRTLEVADRDNGYTLQKAGEKVGGTGGIGSVAELQGRRLELGNFGVPGAKQGGEYGRLDNHLDAEGNILIDAPGSESRVLTQERLREDAADLAVEEWSKRAQFSNVKNTQTEVEGEKGSQDDQMRELAWQHSLLVKNQDKLTSEAVKNIDETIRKNKSLRDLDASRTNLMHGILGGYGRKLGDRN